MLFLALPLGLDDAIDLKMLVQGSGIGVVGALIWILSGFIIIIIFFPLDFLLPSHAVAIISPPSLLLVQLLCMLVCMIDDIKRVFQSYCS